MSSQTPSPTFRTGIGASQADSITLLGHDLAGELLGAITFGELAYWLLTNRRPTGGQRAMFEAVLVALGLKRTAAKFGHGNEHELPGGRRMIDSYHCSRYNTQTRRLTPDMFKTVLERAASLAELSTAR